MKVRRGKASLLLLLLLSSTACQTWQSVSLGALSPAQFVEEDRPDRLRVFISGKPLNPIELEGPTVDGDELIASGTAVPLADITRIEVSKISIGRSVGFGWLAAVAAGLVIQGILCLDSPEDCY
jgi:hypothetical protein